MAIDTKSPFTAVPEVVDDGQSILRAVRALKQNVEVLMGQRGGSGTANQSIVYRQIEGTSSPVGLHDGDQWWQPPVVAGEVWQLSVYWNGKWQRIV